MPVTMTMNFNFTLTVVSENAICSAIRDAYLPYAKILECPALVVHIVDRSVDVKKLERKLQSHAVTWLPRFSLEFRVYLEQSFRREDVIFV